MRALPVLLASGAGALTWRGLQDTLLATTAFGVALDDAYEQCRKKVEAQELRIPEVVGALRAAGCEPVLFKGWAAARLYAVAELRPYGDIDLAVGPERFETALAVLRELRLGEHAVDLHRDAQRLHGRTWDEFFSASRLVPFGEADLRIPSEEDHLRICVAHFLRHGGTRPLWLCDIAAALEAASERIDPAACVEGSSSFVGGMFCVVAAARDLLGARLHGRLEPLTQEPPPEWFQPALLVEWGRERTMQLPLGRSVSPTKLFEELSRRWPNEIEATARCGAAFDDRPRLPYQIRDFVGRGLRWVRG